MAPVMAVSNKVVDCGWVPEINALRKIITYNLNLAHSFKKMKKPSGYSVI